MQRTTNTHAPHQTPIWLVNFCGDLSRFDLTTAKWRPTKPTGHNHGQLARRSHNQPTACNYRWRADSRDLGRGFVGVAQKKPLGVCIFQAAKFGIRRPQVALLGHA